MPHFIFIQQISVLNILNILYNLHFFSSKCRLFHNATLFGFCITHILNIGCAKIWKKKNPPQKVKMHKIIIFKTWFFVKLQNYYVFKILKLDIYIDMVLAVVVYYWKICLFICSFLSLVSDYPKLSYRHTDLTCLWSWACSVLQGL